MKNDIKRKMYGKSRKTIKPAQIRAPKPYHKLMAV
jgi:hypothetical protein